MKCRKKNILNQKKPEISSIYQPKQFKCGPTKGKSGVLEHQVDTEDFLNQTFSHLEEEKESMFSQHKIKGEISATAGSQLARRKKIWKDKLSSLDSNTLTTKLCLILDQESTLKEKTLTPFWTQQSKVISDRLWLPTKIDCVDSVLISSKESSQITPKGKSWFSIKEKHPKNKNSLMTSFRSSQYSQVESMASGVIPSNKKSKDQLKTLKIRLFPREKQKENLDLTVEQFKWFYNSSLTTTNIHYGNKNIRNCDPPRLSEINSSLPIENKLPFIKHSVLTTLTQEQLISICIERNLPCTKKTTKLGAKIEISLNIKALIKIINSFQSKVYSSFTVRDIVRKTKFTSEIKESNGVDLEFTDYVYDEDHTDGPIPYWWKVKPHNRILRGAVKKLVGNLNSAVSNKLAGNIRDFKLGFLSKKNNIEFALFEDSNFPKCLRDINSKYWFTTKDRKRKSILFSTIFEQTKKRGLEIIHEKDTDRYFIHYPVDRDWFPDEDRRGDSQTMLTSDKSRFLTNDSAVLEKERIISIDPGVRKFAVGYDPAGNSVFIGEGASIVIGDLLLVIDKTEDVLEKKKLWRKVKNKINELHWKTISFLVENYDTIIYPDFRVSQMVRKTGKNKLSRLTRRLMCMFSFYKFKERLRFKCDLLGKKLIIVDESFTSKTCGRCGVRNDVKGNEVYYCGCCGIVIDRDVSGARNIFIKNSSLR